MGIVGFVARIEIHNAGRSPCSAGGSGESSKACAPTVVALFLNMALVI